MKKEPKNDLIRLKHMLDYAQRAQTFCANYSRETFRADELVQNAVARALEVLGEASSQITDEFQAKHSQIAWAQIKGMRNRLIHAYFEVNLDIMWDTVQEALPPLIAELQLLLNSNDESSNA